jgi:hypothetical protein
MQAFESVSTWPQPVPPPASPARTEPIDDVAARVARISPGRLRVAGTPARGAGWGASARPGKMPAGAAGKGARPPPPLAGPAGLADNPAGRGRRSPC